jgi:hypothetical protein
LTKPPKHHLSKLILHPQIAPDIRLVQHHNPIGVQLPTVLRTLGRNTKTQGHIGHRKHHDPITRRNILCNPPQPTFQNVVPVQERHLGGGFEPYLVLGIGSEDGQRLYREVEAAAVGDLADASPERDKLWASDIGGALDERVGDVVDLVLVEAEAVAAGRGFGALVRGVLHDVLEVVAGELEELLEHSRGLLLVQRSHLGGLEEEACYFALSSLLFCSSRFNAETNGTLFVLCSLSPSLHVLNS